MFFLEFNKIDDAEAKLTLVTSVFLEFLFFFFADYVLADHDTSGGENSTKAGLTLDKSSTSATIPGRQLS